MTRLLLLLSVGSLVFVEEPENFGGLLYPWNVVKFDPIIISGDNINTFNPEETTNSMEVILHRIGKIALNFTAVTNLKKVQEKLQDMKRVKRSRNDDCDEENVAKK